MNAEFEHNSNGTARDRRNSFISGIAFILLGFFWLANEFIDFNIGALVLPGLALVFIVWGILTRESGLLVPGGILAGVGAGVYLMNSLPLGGSGQPGVFLLSLAAGFASVTVLSRVFSDETHWWALWPAFFIGLTGLALSLGGVALTALEFVGTYWPVVLILIGVSIIFRRK